VDFPEVSIGRCARRCHGRASGIASAARTHSHREEHHDEPGDESRRDPEQAAVGRRDQLVSTRRDHAP
jgi:hypothetical protein